MNVPKMAPIDNFTFLLHLKSSGKLVFLQMVTASDTGVERGVDKLVPQKNAQSVILKWFGFQKTDAEQNIVICKVYCTTKNKRVVAQPILSPGHLYVLNF